MIIIDPGDKRGLVDGVPEKNGPSLRKEPLTQVSRVIPETMKDILFLQGLVNQVEKWAPAFGDGVFVTHKALSRYVR